MNPAFRFVDNNPRLLDGANAFRMPMQTQGIGRTSDRLEDVTERSVMDPAGSSVSKVSHHNADNLEHLRVIYHPAFRTAVKYPQNPDRTVNYHRNPNRKWGVTQTKTLRGSVNTMDLERWDDVVVSEIWLGGQRRITMLTEFFETLYQFTTTRTPIGQYVGWSPFDMSFARHLILPIEIKTGEVDIDIKEIRERLETSLDSYIDRQVTFRFKLVRALTLADTNITIEGS